MLTFCPTKNTMETETGVPTLNEAIEILQNMYGMKNDEALDEIDRLSRKYGDMADALKEIGMKNREYWLSKHKYKITFNEKEKRWRSYLPPDKKSIARAKREDLENLIIEYYKNQEKEEEKPTTFEKLYPQFISYKAQESSAANVYRLDATWRKYIAGDPIIRKKFKDITVPEYTLWFLKLIEDNQLTNRQFNSIKIIFNMMYDYAINMGFTGYNVTRPIIISRKKFAAGSVKEIDEQIYVGNEQAQLVNLAIETYKTSGHMAYLAVAINIMLGLRVAELSSLKISDITEKGVNICRQEVANYYLGKDGKYHSDGFKIVDYTKTVSSKRFVPFSQTARALMDYILDERRKRRTDSEFLFLGKNNEKLHTKSIQNVMYRKLNKELGTAQKSNHSLRKSYLSNLHNSNLFSDSEICRFSGHSNVATLERCYLFPTDPLENKIDEYNQAVDSKIAGVLPSTPSLAH